MTAGGRLEHAAPVEVVAGALIDREGRVLIAERPAGKAHAGRWEFPGGKRNPDEAPYAALERELAEELGIELERAVPLLKVAHHYATDARAVVIDCWRVEAWRGTPKALDRQRLRWCTRAELARADILEADRGIVSALLLPPRFVHVDSPAAAAPRAAGDTRIAWLVDSTAADAARIRHCCQRGDVVIAIDAPRRPAAPVGVVYTSLERFRPARSRVAMAGCVVREAGAACAAATAGADFLLVPGEALAPPARQAIASSGLPWYCGDTATPSELAAPTGQLSWPGWRPAHG